MKNDEVLAGERYWWQPERDSVTGELPPKQDVTVVRKTGRAGGQAQSYAPSEALPGPTAEDRLIEIKTENGKQAFVKASELEPLGEKGAIMAAYALEPPNDIVGRIYLYTPEEDSSGNRPQPYKVQVVEKPERMLQGINRGTITAETPLPAPEDAHWMVRVVREGDSEHNNVFRVKWDYLSELENEQDSQERE